MDYQQNLEIAVGEDIVNNNLKLETAIKHNWYYATPNRLYDQCINVIIKNINKILVKTPNVTRKNGAKTSGKY